jgi:hypothetical protein
MYVYALPPCPCHSTVGYCRIGHMLILLVLSEAAVYQVLRVSLRKVSQIMTDWRGTKVELDFL